MQCAFENGENDSELLNGWIAVAITSETEGGLGATLNESASTLKAEWLDLPVQENIRRKWNDVRKTQELEFNIVTD